MTEPARTHRRRAPKRTIRAAKTGNAREAIGTLTPGCELYILTYGQFSLIDALVALLEQTGPADVALSTWTAAHADLSEAHRLVRDGAMRSFRLILDANMRRRPNAQKLVRDVIERFGVGAIRMTASHAKFVAIRTAVWSLAVRTSMNLNQNPRLENIEISDDPALCAFLELATDDIFAEQAAGEFAGEIPALANIADGARRQVRTGKATVGHVSTGART